MNKVKSFVESFVYARLIFDVKDRFGLENGNTVHGDI